MKKNRITFVICAILLFSNSFAQEKQEVESVKTDLASQLTYQRGIEAAIWAMPAVSMEFFWNSAFRDFGMDYNDVLAMSKTADQNINY